MITGRAAAGLRARRRAQLTAIHEAGHVLAAWTPGYPPLGASIIRDAAARHEGITVYSDPLVDVSLESAGEDPQATDSAGRAVVIALAGPLAERNFAPKCRLRGHESDHARAAEILLTLGGEDEQHRNLYMRLLWRRAELLVSVNWPQITAVADALVEHLLLDISQLAGVLADVRTTPFLPTALNP